MLSYVTKTLKGMSAIMDRACTEARQGNMDIKASVRHMGNAFLNGVETSAQEAACLVLQLPITRMSRKVVFVMHLLQMKEHSYSRISKHCKKWIQNQRIYRVTIYW